MADFAELIKGARLPEDEVPTCLRPDLVRSYEALDRELVEVSESDPDANSVAAGGKAIEIAEQMDALRAEMLEHTHPFAFRALPKPAYRELLDKHPPRKGDEQDELMGANLATFPTALIAACAIDPPMTEQQVTELCDLVSDGQVLRFFDCVMRLNRSSVDVPKSALASEILARHAPRSKQPEPGG